MSNLPMPLPDGMEESEITNLDLGSIAGLIRTDPEKAMIMLDYAMKMEVRTSRQGWIRQAKILYVVEATGVWRYHPDSYSTFLGWCSQPEINVPQSVASDMTWICKLAPEIQAECDIDIFDLIEEVGQSKIRTVLPTLKDAREAGTLADTAGSLLEEIKGSSYRDVMEMVNPGGVRLDSNLEAIYVENDDGTHNVMFKGLSFDQMDLLSSKLGIKRWYDKNGYRIESPLDPK